MGYGLIWGVAADGRLTLKRGELPEPQHTEWANPDRQALLVQLWEKSQGFCVYGHRPCLGRWTERTGRACSFTGIGCEQPDAGGLCRFDFERDGHRPSCDFRKWSILRWECHYGHTCKAPYGSHYAQVEQELIDWWRADAREQARLEHRIQKRIDTGERGPLRGEWNETAREVFHAAQPDSYFERIGVSPVNFKPFAVVKVPSTSTELMIPLGDTLRPLSRHKRRKVIRYGKGIPQDIQSRIDLIIHRAVKGYWERR